MRNWVTVSVLSLAIVVGAFFWWFKYHSPGRVPITSDPNAINSNDPRMAAAEAQARRTWPEFLSLFRNKQPLQHFYVKAKFRNGFNFEPLWVEVDAIHGDTIVGSVETKPTVVKYVKVGTPITVARADIVDWFFRSNTEERGGFTDKVIDAIEAERRPGAKPATRQG